MKLFRPVGCITLMSLIDANCGIDFAVQPLMRVNGHEIYIVVVVVDGCVFYLV